LIWYAVVRFLLENLRVNNWTFFSIPTAMLVSGIAIVGSIVLLAVRHRPGAVWEPWGDPPPPEDELLDDEDWIEDEAVEDEDGKRAADAEADETDEAEADAAEAHEADDTDEADDEDDAGDGGEGAGDDPGAGDEPGAGTAGATHA
ncbi:MAG TPA: hypothetical protein VGM28_07265, partial [Candidatus Limnocylindrales bacterium]